MRRDRGNTGRRAGRIAQAEDVNRQTAADQRVDEAVQPRVGDVVPAGQDGDVDAQTSSMVERVRLTPRKSV
jgi:hypothetical protein